MGCIFCYKLSGPKPSGISCLSVYTVYSSGETAMRIRNVSGLQNSIITWRQTPQGAVFCKGLPSGAATIAMAEKRRFPSLIP